MSRPKSVEAECKAAFERLKVDTPKLLPKGSPVSLTNVAKEAGKKPTSLRGDRYPALCKEITAYIELNKLTPSRKKNRKSRESDKRRIKRLKLENEKLTNILLSVISRNEELEHEVTMLRDKKVVDIGV